MIETDNQGNFILSLPSMPENVSAAIARQLPRVELDEIEDIAHAFFAMPFLELSDPKQQREALYDLAKLAEQMSEIVKFLGPDQRAELQKSLKASGAPNLKSVRFALTCLTQCSPLVAQDIRPARGRPQTTKRYLVRELAKLLEKSGYPADSSPSGPLVYLVYEVLAWLIGKPGDVRSLVRNSLRN